jgi:hypothetical protein
MMASAGEKVGWLFNPSVRVRRFVYCALLIDAPFAPHAPDLASYGCLSCTRWCAAVVLRACPARAFQSSECAPGSGPRMLQESGPPGFLGCTGSEHREASLARRSITMRWDAGKCLEIPRWGQDRTRVFPGGAKIEPGSWLAGGTDPNWWKPA